MKAAHLEALLAAHDEATGFLDSPAVETSREGPGTTIGHYRLLQEIPNPSEEEIRYGMSGNLCRCTGYQNIVKAVQYAAAKMQSKSEAA